MVLGAKRLGNLISKFERGGEAGGSRETERLTTQRKRVTPRSKTKEATAESLQIGDKIALLDSQWKDCKFERGGEADDSRQIERSTTQRKRLAPSSKRKQATTESLKIDDKIVMLDSPWKDCTFERGGEAGDSSETERPTTQRKRLTPRSKKKQASAESLKIGDKIALLDSPWKDCLGMYSCKSIRRSDFAESAMVAFAGAFGALAVSQSSKQFLMIVDRHIVEFTKLNQNTGRVAFVSSVDDLYKMRLRQQDELITLFFKSASDDPIIYKCSESKFVSQLIRASKGSVMVRREAIHRAQHLVQEIQAQERALEYRPSRERVNEITTLYEKAAQQFVIAEDDRHKEVVEHKLRFLALPLVVSILNGTCPESKAQPKREPEILEGSSEELDGQAINRMDSDEISAVSGPWEQLGKCQEDKVFDESVDDILFEARQDFEHLHIHEGGWNGDAFGRDRVAEGITNEITDEETGGDISFADLDAMMKAADKELQEILKM